MFYVLKSQIITGCAVVEYICEEYHVLHLTLVSESNSTLVLVTQLLVFPSLPPPFSNFPGPLCGGGGGAKQGERNRREWGISHALAKEGPSYSMEGTGILDKDF